jgi:hypothetical protein
MGYGDIVPIFGRVKQLEISFLQQLVGKQSAAKGETFLSLNRSFCHKTVA